MQHLASAGNGFLGIPLIGFVALGVLMIGDFILDYTKFGRYVFMTGGNREAAEMSGVDTRKVLLNVMVSRVSRLAWPGMLFVGRLNSANPAAGGEPADRHHRGRRARRHVRSSVARVGSRTPSLGLLIFGFLSNGLNLLPWVDIYFKEALQGSSWSPPSS